MKNDTQITENDINAGALSNPINFLQSGSFSYNGGYLNNRGTSCGYWTLRSLDTNNTDYFLVSKDYLDPLYRAARGYGFAVRCDKSFTTLINTSYSMKNNGETEEDNRDSGLLSNPLSFLRSGLFGWDNAGLGNRGGIGYYWSLRSGGSAVSVLLVFNTTFLDPQNSDPRGQGFAVRYLGLAPDSICPKGWQLPTYSGDKSFTTLINTSYSMKTDGQTIEADSGALSNPLTFLRSGSFTWNGAILSYRSNYGYCWSLRSANTISSNILSFNYTYLNPQNLGYRGDGFAVRCSSSS